MAAIYEIFFFNDTATTEIYTLSLHDALPISAERVTVDAGLLEKQIHYAAYLQEEPKDAERIKNGAPAELKVDGEWLLVDPKTKRSWAAPAPAVVNANDTSGGKKIGRAHV